VRVWISGIGFGAYVGFWISSQLSFRDAVVLIAGDRRVAAVPALTDDCPNAGGYLRRQCPARVDLGGVAGLLVLEALFFVLLWPGPLGPNYWIALSGYRVCAFVTGAVSAGAYVHLTKVVGGREKRGDFGG
jgi:hypothetical protein